MSEKKTASTAKPKDNPPVAPMLSVHVPKDPQLLPSVQVPKKKFLVYPDPKRRISNYKKDDRPDISANRSSSANKTT